MNKNSWLTIIGIGDDGWNGLSSNHKDILLRAKTIFGGKRHIEFLPETVKNNAREWPSPLKNAFPKLHNLKGTATVILASGDPMFFGIGATLLREFTIDEITILPHPSSFSLAASRLGWALQDVECFSVHGRPISVLQRHFQNNLKIFILSENKETPSKIAQLLTEKGFGQTKMTIFEHLNGKDEHLFHSTANSFKLEKGADLNIIALECIADKNAVIYPPTTPLPDEFFYHDGQLTKQDIRAVVMAHLAPKYGEVLWDIGAGCGSISIEWLRNARNTRAYAIEKNQERQKLILKNAQNFGVPFLNLIAGTAPESLEELEKPDAIFIGGGLTSSIVVEHLWSKLKSGGRLIANGVTLETVALLQSYAKTYNGRLINIAVSHSETLGRFQIMRPTLAVTLLIAIKP
ncbi:bifunctional cobalt-precorrin-7 (C(5))-methyltransferase/cobalt-precorrin-6B (C(15))-methyltransferase [Bartonella tamiae]|uniref:Precorrin-6y C5,15-methyltransferase (Decarboxylating), CbiE subunit n=1 Tax=Bartonella tamiae Th239 TaxID=1094558 RepID=J0QZZ7_9HYPH|nr:bifunctional cobalt-precorrin-7 (C(5))-methyltransferase/cobalt-precorrin-6B (C(15))-methyltransferase [Bartonella tamiae]EJF88829.1 precorrin-6y C5,15-methyltransferase (decarboxylating), CbiE subunit [Bartonella tamiae Th239]EJF94921.1 precorrin-6y C5,15-methyltransferase (decarboxylating), CbiE subunit [Bartonella tamiae Th307]